MLHTEHHCALCMLTSVHVHLSPTATIIIAKWRMYILRKKYRQLRAARESLHMNTPVKQTCHYFPSIYLFFLFSFLLLPLLPLFLPVPPPHFPPLLFSFPLPSSPSSSPPPLLPSLPCFLPSEIVFSKHWKRIRAQRFIRKYRVAVAAVRK